MNNHYTTESSREAGDDGQEKRCKNDRGREMAAKGKEMGTERGGGAKRLA